jgi:hypothetical protein
MEIIEKHRGIAVAPIVVAAQTGWKFPQDPNKDL